MKKIWYTVYGTFSPNPSVFDEETEALEYAKRNVNDWAKDVSVVKSEVVWRSDDAKRI
jgi:hypothetical protein